MAGNFQLMSQVKANHHVPVEKYRSAATGLTVVIAQVNGPIVNGYFGLATEAHDDDGLPHTLEHLIFLGSEEFPFKGVLDLLSNRCLSSGTNAWTDTDHTCYTMTTAGSEGFLNLLPIYLDHILYPTLTESGFVTEVHHVTGEGQDGGVVYCEMQGRENTGESRTHLEMLRAMYPGHCGYKSETGGIMLNLRETTTNQKVRDYHRDYYRPENLCIIITGRLDPHKVFEALQPVEAKILAKGRKEPFERPWQSPVPPLESSKEVEVQYPADEELNGLVHVAWRGPHVVRQLYEMFATMVLMEYLTETSVSPLQANFVEVDKPLASQVSYSFIENSESTVYLMFKNVPMAKIGEVEGVLMRVLKDIVSGEIPWDAGRMNTVIQRRVLEQLSQMENAPHDSLAFMVVGDLLYGESHEDFHIRLNSVDQFKKLQTEPDSFWKNIIQTLLLDKPKVVCKGLPSMELQVKLQAEEEERVNKRKEQLGEAGLQEKAALLEAAIEENEHEPPEELMRSLPIPSTESIAFHPLTSYSTNSANQPPGLDLRKMPVFFQFDQVDSNFVYLFPVLNTDEVPVPLKPYLPLLLELLMESPMLEDGGTGVIPYEDVVAQLASDFLIAKAGLGLKAHRFLPGSYAQAAVLVLQTVPEKYGVAVSWVRRLLYQTKLTAERVRVLATKMENSVAELKRRGSKVTSTLLHSLLFSEASNYTASNMFTQQKFLGSVVARLDFAPNKVLSELEEVRAILTSPHNILIHMAANLDTLSAAGDPQAPWHSFLPPHLPKRVSSLRISADHLLTRGLGEHVVTARDCIESSYMESCTPSITEFKNEDLPALMLFNQYLVQTEGPMWRQIRGQGLAYGYFMYPMVSKGQLFLSLYKATHLVKAYAEAKRIAMSYVNGEEEFEDNLLESAKSSLIFELIEKEVSVGEAIQESLLTAFKGTDSQFNRELLNRINRVSIEELKAVGSRYIAPLFQGETSRTAIVCSPGKVQSIVEGFASLGVKLRVMESLEESACLA